MPAFTPARALKSSLIGLLLMGVSACGFTPLYADKGLNYKLAHIDVVATQTRTGYFIEQELAKGLIRNSADETLYRLNIELKENRYPLGLNIDDTATRYEISTLVKYTLVDVKSRKILLTGGFTDATTYDAAESPYAGMASQLDGQERAATGISQKIQSELALYFHNQK